MIIDIFCAIKRRVPLENNSTALAARSLATPPPPPTPHPTPHPSSLACKLEPTQETCNPSARNVLVCLQGVPLKLLSKPLLFFLEKIELILDRLTLLCLPSFFFVCCLLLLRSKVCFLEFAECLSDLLHRAVFSHCDLVLSQIVQYQLRAKASSTLAHMFAGGGQQGRASEINVYGDS